MQVTVVIRDRQNVSNRSIAKSETQIEWGVSVMPLGMIEFVEEFRAKQLG